MDIRSISASGSATTAAQSAEDKKLKAACRDMEAVFLNMLLSRMRATVPKNTLTNSNQQEIVQSMLDSELTQGMARAGGTGLADMLYRQLSQTSQNPERVLKNTQP
jgi:flagellar protein FlgJ